MYNFQMRGGKVPALQRPEADMRKPLILTVACVVSSTAAPAQEWKPVVAKWRACADATAARYSKSAESAAAVARLAALACHEEKKQASQAVVQVEGAAFGEQFIEAAERHYIDRLSVNVMEMRLKGTEK
jgi:hypothetical protein